MGYYAEHWCTTWVGKLQTSLGVDAEVNIWNTADISIASDQDP